MSEEKSEKSLSEKITDLWREDSEIDRHNVANEGAKITKLHHKYLNYYRQCSAKIIDLESKKHKLYLDKSTFYGGKSDPKVYREKGFHLKVLKADMDTYINADDDYIKVHQMIAELKLAQELLKSILEQLKNRNFTLRNILEYDKFTSGSG